MRTSFRQQRHDPGFHGRRVEDHASLDSGYGCDCAADWPKCTASSFLLKNRIVYKANSIKGSFVGEIETHNVMAIIKLARASSQNAALKESICEEKVNTNKDSIVDD